MGITSNNSTTEDFSFPVISNPLTDFRLPSTTLSSSLWRISSKVYHHLEDELELNIDDDHEDDSDEEGNYKLEVRSVCEEIMPSISVGRELVKCSSFRGGRHEDKDKDKLNVEERMDFLWQDFNEEEEESRGNINMRRSGSKQVCVVQKRFRKFGRHNTLVVIGKLLKGLVSMRKSSNVRILKPRF